MRNPLEILAFGCALAAAVPAGLPSKATAAGFTLLYSADDRGEITPCG